MPKNKDIKLKLNFIDETSGELALVSGGQTLATQPFSFNRDLDRVLLSALDKLLLKNTMSLISLKTYQISGRVSRYSLSYQIAQAVLSGVV